MTNTEACALNTWEQIVQAARELKAASRFDDAEAILEHGLTELPRAPWIAHEYALTAGARGNWDEAFRRWAAVIDKFPDHPIGYVDYARALQARGRLDDAESLLQKAMARISSERWILHQHAILAGARRDWKEATKRWSEVLLRFPDHAAGYTEYGDTLRMNGELDEADSVLAQGMQRFPNEYWIAHRSVMVADARGDLAETIERWKRFLASTPCTEPGADVIVNIAVSFRWKRDLYLGIFDATIAVLNSRGHDSDPRRISLLNTMLASGAFGDTIDVAMRWKQEAREPDFLSQISSILGHAYLCVGEIQKATGVFCEALELSKDALNVARAVLGFACVKLDGGFIEDASDHVHITEKLFRLSGRTLVLPACQIARNWKAKRTPLSRSNVEVVIFTSAPKRVRNTEFLAPSVKMVTKLVDSLRHTTLSGTQVPISIFLDHKNSPLELEYKANLIEFAKGNAVNIEVNVNKGLRGQWIDAFHKTKADLVLIVEHDHEFSVSCPKVDDLIRMMNDRPDINYLRLNRRDNLAHGDDAAFFQSKRDVESGIIRVNLFSNTPHMIRRSFYSQFIGPIIAENEFVKILHTGAEGIEENVNMLLMREYEPVMGISAASRLLGMAIFGHQGDKAVVKNLGF